MCPTLPQGTMLINHIPLPSWTVTASLWCLSYLNHRLSHHQNPLRWRLSLLTFSLLGFFSLLLQVRDPRDRLMAAVATVTENATELMGKLALDTKSKPHAAPDNTKKTGLYQPYERSLTPLLQEYMDSNNMCYMPTGYPSTTYYYDGYNGSGNEWENYSRYVTPEGVEMPPPGHYEDMYHQGYGYAPYGVYPSPGSPVPTMGHDGQMYGPQHYQYPATYYQPSTTAVTQYTPNLAPPQGEVSTSAAPVHPTISVETVKPKLNEIPNGNANGNSGPAPPKPGQHNPSLASNGLYCRGVLSTGHLSSNYQDPRYTFDGVRSPVPWFDGSVLGNGQYRQGNTGAISSPVSHINNSSCARSPNLRPLQHGTGLRTARPTSGVVPTSPGIMNRMYPNNQMYTQCGNTYRTGLGIGPNFYDPRAIGRWGIAVDNKYRPRGRGNGLYGYNNENLDGLSELNRGPRAGRFKTPKVAGPTVTIGDKDHSAVLDKDQYNRADFDENFLDAKFFIIKSYSEDDLHKSIKYNVWASTPNGNIKLDAAYKEAQQKPVACPVFLFFSVNTSGQFVGAAEMVGPVDFDKTVNYWQQDKWTGCFPVKWHIVKDVPNNLLKHITLENNDNKPVTNSRDTQEVKLDQGLQMLKLFKEHASKTSILEDFHFYETRQKAIQEKRSKQQHLQRQIVEVKAVSAVDENDKDGATGKPRLQKPLEKVTVAKKEPVQVGLSERKASDENTVAVVAGNPPKVSRPAPEKRILTNGVANG